MLPHAVQQLRGRCRLSARQAGSVACHRFCSRSSNSSSDGSGSRRNVNDSSHQSVPPAAPKLPRFQQLAAQLLRCDSRLFFSHTLLNGSSIRSCSGISTGVCSSNSSVSSSRSGTESSRSSSSNSGGVLFDFSSAPFRAPAVLLRGSRSSSSRQAALSRSGERNADSTSNSGRTGDSRSSRDRRRSQKSRTSTEKRIIATSANDRALCCCCCSSAAGSNTRSCDNVYRKAYTSGSAVCSEVSRRCSNSNSGSCSTRWSNAYDSSSTWNRCNSDTRRNTRNESSRNMCRSSNRNSPGSSSRSCHQPRLLSLLLRLCSSSSTSSVHSSSSRELGRCSSSSLCSLNREGSSRNRTHRNVRCMHLSARRNFSIFDLPRYPTRTTTAEAEKRRAAAPLAAARGESELQQLLEQQAEAAERREDGSRPTATGRKLLPTHFAVALLPLEQAAAAAAGEPAAATGAAAAASPSPVETVQQPLLYLDPVGAYAPVLNHCSSSSSRLGAAAEDGEEHEELEEQAAAGSAAATARGEKEEEEAMATAAAEAAAAEGAAAEAAAVGATVGGIGVEDVGRFRLFDRHRLLELMPEGLAGELPQDLELIPSATTSVGVMLRRATLELQVQLQQFARCHSSSSSSAQQQQQKCSSGSRPSSFAVDRGFLLDGHRGVGKSCVLNYLVPWARENGWLVVFEPRPSKYAREIGSIKRSAAGVYIQATFAQEFLERLGRFNQPLLEQLPVCRSCYGQSALDGVHRLYAERSYYNVLQKAVEKDMQELLQERRVQQSSSAAAAAYEAGGESEEDLAAVARASRVYHAAAAKEAHLSDQELREEIELARERLKLWHAYRNEISMPSLRSKLPQPTHVWQIAEAGLQHEAFATQALYETWEQLKKQTLFNLLIVVDEWNECFPVSEYVSMRYEGTRYNGYIPAFHLSTPRLLAQFEDASQFRRGLKLLATSWKRSNRRTYRPDLLGIKTEEVRTVRNFTPFEFSTYVAYLQKKGVLHAFPKEKLGYFYMLCGGNGFQARRLLATLY